MINSILTSKKLGEQLKFFAGLPDEINKSKAKAKDANFLSRIKDIK